jgi:hypothetical protein
VGPQVEARVRELRSVRLLVVDIRDWNSPVAKQLNIRSIPQLWLMHEGELVTDDARKILRMLDS